MVHVIIQGVKGFFLFLNKIVVFSLKIIIDIANSVDPDEMPHYAAFNLDLLCLQL